MRDIKFRGKRIDNSEWVYGYYINQEFNDKHLMAVNVNNGIDGLKTMYYEVDQETVGQYVGKKDKSGFEIYDGDVVKWSDGDYKSTSNPRIAVVAFTPELSFLAINMKYNDLKVKINGKIFSVHKFGYSNFIYTDTENHFDIIGNLDDNPGLLSKNYNG